MSWERLVLKYEKENQALALLDKYKDDVLNPFPLSPLRSDWTDAEYCELLRHYKKMSKAK